MCSPYFVYYCLVHSLKQIILKYSAALTFEKISKTQNLRYTQQRRFCLYIVIFNYSITFKALFHINNTLISASSELKHQALFFKYKSAVYKVVCLFEQIHPFGMFVCALKQFFVSIARVCNYIISVFVCKSAKLCKCLCLTKRFAARKSKSLQERK